MVEFTDEEKRKMVAEMNRAASIKYSEELQKVESAGDVTAKNRELVEFILAFRHGYGGYYGPFDSNSALMRDFRLMADGSYTGEPYYRAILSKLKDSEGKDKALRSLAIGITLDMMQQEFPDLSRSTIQKALVKHLGPDLEKTNKILVQELRDMAKNHDIPWAIEHRSTGPGKFESSGNIGEVLHGMTMDGSADEEAGDVQYAYGWNGLMVNTGVKGAEHVIVNEDSNGFFDYTAYDTEAKARAAWKALTKEINEAEAEAEEYEYRNDPKRRR